MLSHVCAWLRRTLGGRCNSTHSLFPFSVSFNKRVKTRLSLKTLIVHLREAMEPLNAEAINNKCLRYTFCIVHVHCANTGRGKIEAHKSWFMGIPEKRGPVTGTTLIITGLVPAGSR